MEGDDGLKLEEEKKSEVNNIWLPSITSNWRHEKHHKISEIFPFFYLHRSYFWHLKKFKNKKEPVHTRRYQLCLKSYQRIGQARTNPERRKLNQILFVAFMESLRKAKVFWLFKLPSSKHILHGIAQSPYLINYSRVLLIIKEWFGRSQWRTSFSNKS